MGGPLGWLTGPGAHPGWGLLVAASIGRTPGCPRAAWSSGPDRDGDPGAEPQ